MKKRYITELLKMFKNIASGRKNFNFYENRISKNLILTKKYFKKNKRTLHNK